MASAVKTEGGESLVSATTLDPTIEILYKSYGELTTNTGEGDASESFKALLGVCKEGSAQTRKMAAEFVPEFCHRFPDQFEDALNAQLDLIEAADAAVRLEATRGLPKMCEHNTDHVGRIADVLGQLLMLESESELAVVKVGLTKVISKNVAAALEALVKQILDGGEEQIRDKVLSFITGPEVRRQIGSAAGADEETERAVVTALKKLLEPSVSLPMDHFKNVFMVLRSLKLFRDKANASELVDIIAANARAPADDFDITNKESLSRLVTYYSLVKAQFFRGADSGSLLRFLAKKILPSYAAIPEEEGLAVLKLFAELSQAATLDVAAETLHGVYLQLMAQLSTVAAAKEALIAASKKAAEKKPAEKKAAAEKAEASEEKKEAAEGAEGDDATAAEASGDADAAAEPEAKEEEHPSGPSVRFIDIECLLFAFHQLASKVPRLLPAVCGLVIKPKVFTGQPTDLMTASDINSSEAEKFHARLKDLVEGGKLMMGHLRAGLRAMKRPEKDAPAEEKAAHSKKRLHVLTLLDTIANESRLANALQGDPTLLGGDKASLSFRRGGKGQGKGGKGGAGAGGAGPKAQKRKAGDGAGEKSGKRANRGQQQGQGKKKGQQQQQGQGKKKGQQQQQGQGKKKGQQQQAQGKKKGQQQAQGKKKGQQQQQGQGKKKGGAGGGRKPGNGGGGGGGGKAQKRGGAGGGGRGKRGRRGN